MTPGRAWLMLAMAAAPGCDIATLHESSDGPEPDPHVVDLVVGASVACVLLSTGRVMCWGDNNEGSVGIGYKVGQYVRNPTILGDLHGVVQLANVGRCALLDDGTGRCWGDNLDGWLGDGYGNSYTVPAEVYGETDLVRIWFGAGQRSDGTMVAWGMFIGDGSTTATAIPTVVDLMPFRELVSGSPRCLVDLDHRVWCWGFNIDGVLGDQSVGTSFVPYRIEGVTDVRTVSIGTTICTLRLDGTVWCWGGNSFGGAGQGYTSWDPAPPGEVVGLGPSGPGPIAGVTALWDAACALLQSGDVWCVSAPLG